MNITRNNYEAFLIDYMDGRLDPIQSNQLLNFLTQNPDLKKEFERYENIKISPSKDIHLKKQILKRNFSDIKKINKTNFEEFCIAKLEGDLQENDEIRLSQYMDKHPEMIKDYNLYSRLYLKPDYNIKYPGKNNIKKSVLLMYKRSMYFYVSSAAAIIIVIMLVFMPKKQKEEISKVQFADITPEKEIVQKKETQNNTEIDLGSTLEEIKEVQPANKILNTRLKNAIPDKPINNTATREKEMLSYLNPIEAGIENTFNYPNLIMNRLGTTENYQEGNFALKDIFIRKLKNSILQKDFSTNIKNKIIWSAAEAGIKSYNYLTESEVELEKKLNSEGKVVAFALNSESFSISSPLMK